MKFYFDNTYGRILDPHFHSANRVAAIPGLLPLNVYYVGQTKNAKGETIDHANRASVMSWASEFKGKKIPVLFDNETPDIITTPWNNPNMEANLRRCHQFADWYRQADPAARLGAWHAVPAVPGDASISKENYAKLNERLRPWQDKLDFAVAELYQSGTIEQWHEMLRWHVPELLKFDHESIAVLCPIHQVTGNPLSVADFEFQLREVHQAGYNGVFIWIGADNPEWLHPGTRISNAVTTDLIETIERAVKLYS